MDRLIRNQLLKDIEAEYKLMMPKLYMRYRQLSSSEVSEMFYYWISKHRHEKVMELIDKRTKRKIRYKKVKSELEEIKTKLELANYVEGL